MNRWPELTVGVGEYLAHGTPVALVHGGDLRDHDVTRFFLIGGERTFVQDPAFGFRELVDIAILRASLAVNDPTTGVQAIDRLSDLLGITGTGWIRPACGLTPAVQSGSSGSSATSTACWCFP